MIQSLFCLILQALLAELIIQEKTIIQEHFENSFCNFDLAIILIILKKVAILLKNQAHKKVYWEELMATKNLLPKSYLEVLNDIKKKIKAAQATALKFVNHELINLYWDIGEIIAARQKEEGWGKSIVEKLASDIQSDFPAIKGFSARNIWYMRQLYQCYQKNLNLQTLFVTINWTHNIIILEKCEDNLEREFYIKMTRKYGWSSRVLINSIENKSYRKTLLSQTNFDANLPENLREKAKHTIKDEYTFDFLELGDEFSERQLENALCSKVQQFLSEMGGTYAFIGSQYRIEVDDEEYFIDLLLYHRLLKCLVAVELKKGKFIPEYVGKMQFYLSVLDATARFKEENAPIGIILCKSKNKMIVEFALKDSNKPIGIAAYSLVKNLPDELQKHLPTAEQIGKLLNEI